MTAAEAPRDFWLRLSPDVYFSCGEHLTTLVSESGALEIRGNGAVVAEVLTALREGAWLSTLGRSAGACELQAILAHLVDRRWVVTERDDAMASGPFAQVLNWLSSLTVRPVTALKSLQGAAVAVVGVGGLGGELLQHLAGSGVGTALLFDGDVVEPSNLNRQFLFDRDAIGRPKAVVAAAKLTSRNAEMRVTTFPHFVACAADLQCLDPYSVDVVVNCADGPVGLDGIIAGYCAGRRIPFVTAGVGLQRGYWGPFLPDSADSALMRFEQQLDVAQGPFAARWDKSQICKSSHGPYNSIVAAHLASDVIRHLSGTGTPHSLGQRMYIDFDSLTITAVGGGEDHGATVAERSQEPKR